MNKKIYFVLFVALIARLTIYPQVKLENYSSAYNQINFNLLLNSLNYTKITKPDGQSVVSFENYSDESRPGDYSLPSREIYIALPAYSKVNVEITRVEENRISGVPNLNPMVKQVNDSTLEYYKPDNSLRKNSPVSVLFKVKGYLWIRDYYCVNIQINQYRFNNADIISELKKLNINIKILNPDISLRKTIVVKDTNFSKTIKNLILNYTEAQPLNKINYSAEENNDDWINFNDTYLKLGTSEDGIYRVTKNDLDNNGIASNQIDPKTFKLFVRGKEQPIYVYGENDGKFDAADFIEFFGSKNWGENTAQAVKYRETSTGTESYKEYLNRYSDTTIYWLTWNGNNGLRVDTLSNINGTPTDTLQHYSEIVHYENNLFLDYSVPDIVTRQDPIWLPNETWVWGQQAPGSVDRPFTTRDIFPGKNAQAFYKVQDFATDGFFGAHKIGLSINSDPAVYDSSAFNKYEQKVVKANFSSNLLNEGNNVLKTISYSTNTSINSVEYDWYEVEYPRYLKATNDSLKILFDGLTFPGIKFVKITNVSSNNVVLYKYSPIIKKITNFSYSGSNIIFSDTVQNGDKYVLLPAANIIPPKVYYKKIFTDLKSSSLQADYILLTHPAFISKASEYTNFISANYGLTTKIINVNDIYDQFNYGFFAPEPIRDFLQAANLNWQSPKPSYLFIVGDATYDYYGNKTKYFGSPATYNYVPSFGDPVSDNWYAIWDTTGSLIQQMYVGRIPINNLTEFGNYFDKHKKYLSDPYDVFNKTYLLFSSGASQWELDILKSTNDYVHNSIIKPAPVGGVANHLYKTLTPPSNFGPFTEQQVAKYIGDGGLFISYIGHSGTQIWDNGINTIQQLKNNSGKGSLISDWGCSTGKFAEPDIKSFSELFINEPDGQAIAYNGNSSLGFVSTATTFPQLFYANFLLKNITSIGEAHAKAKADFLKTYGTYGVYRIFALTNTLLGDPVVSLKVPTQANLSLNSSDISLGINTPQANIDDSKDSVQLKAVYYNLGLVDTSSFIIRVTDNLNGNEILNKTFSKSLPLYSDSLIVYIPTKNLPGNHQIKITLDDAGILSEISKSDNTVDLNLNVASSSVRVLVQSNNNFTSKGEFVFLNPITQGNSDSLVVEYAGNSSFSNSTTIIKKLDTLATKINLSNLIPNKRYWLRSKLNSTDLNFGGTISFVYDPLNDFNYSLRDSISFNSLQTSNLKFGASGLQLQPSRNEFILQSAGFYDGSYAIINLNGTDYITNSNAGGHHIVVFDAKTLQFEYEKFLNYYDAPNTYEANYLAMIDSIPNDKIIAIAASDEPAGGLTAAVRSKLKFIGSTLIDSVQFRDSWGIITQKNFTPGKVLEGRTKNYDGPVVLDTVITQQNSTGSFTTDKIGPAAKWLNIGVGYSVPVNSGITIKTIGIKQDDAADTLSVSNLNSNTIDLSGYNATTYPYLKFYFQMSSTDSTSLPFINTLDVNYNSDPELGINYQLVSINKDTVIIGQNIKLDFSVMNIGESPADSFNVIVEVLHPDNTKNEITNEQVSSITSGGSKKFSVNYTADVSTGINSFLISIDAGNKIAETFKDNNFYTAQFFVKADTNKPDIFVTFDGQKIIDNDFVSNHPKINIELNDPSFLPVTDTTSISIELNGQPVYYAGNSSILNYKFNSANPKMAVEYSPVLGEGKQTLTVTGGNSLGNKAMVVKKDFVVTSSPKILSLYNYPNPFRSETYITFKLTQIPEELKIKIYTVAGRMIKEFILHPPDLNFDFNRIYWDGRDQDGSLVANGVYLYKAVMTAGGKVQSLTQKMALVR